jgi:predicted GIY-YIG superfamily endonuclease
MGIKEPEGAFLNPALTLACTAMYYLYVLESEEGELYYGSTNDLRRRLAEHTGKKSRTTRKGNWTLVYYEAYRAEEDARRREQQIKLHGQAKRQLRERIRTSRQSQS